MILKERNLSPAYTPSYAIPSQTLFHFLATDRSIGRASHEPIRAVVVVSMVGRAASPEPLFARARPERLARAAYKTTRALLGRHISCSSWARPSPRGSRVGVGVGICWGRSNWIRRLGWCWCHCGLADARVGAAPDECDGAVGLAAVEGAEIGGGAAVVEEALGTEADIEGFGGGQTALEAAGAGYCGHVALSCWALGALARGDDGCRGGEGEESGGDGDGSREMHFEMFLLEMET